MFFEIGFPMLIREEERHKLVCLLIFTFPINPEKDMSRRISVDFFIFIVLFLSPVPKHALASSLFCEASSVLSAAG